MVGLDEAYCKLSTINSAAISSILDIVTEFSGRVQAVVDLPNTRASWSGNFFRHIPLRHKAQRAA